MNITDELLLKKKIIATAVVYKEFSMKVLVVVDMQKDFIDGALGTKEAVQIVPAVKNKIAEYRKNNDLVIFTRDTHQENYLETQEGKNLPVRHCIKNTEGWEIDSNLDVEESCVIDKPSFGSLELADFIAGVNSKNPIEQIELCGLCTDICVISNALILKAKLPEVLISVDKNACAGVTPESHNNALNAMKMCQIKVE